MCYAIHGRCSNPGTNSLHCKKCTKVVGASCSNNLLHALYEFKDWFLNVSKTRLCNLLRFGTPPNNTAQGMKERSISGKSVQVWLQLLLLVCSIHNCTAHKTRGLPRISRSHKGVNLKKKSLWGPALFPTCTSCRDATCPHHLSSSVWHASSLGKGDLPRSPQCKYYA